MGDKNWKQYIFGEPIPFEQNNQWLNYREYSLYATLLAESLSWSVTESPRIAYCYDSKAFYYWNGVALVVWPSEGGSGAPVAAPYITYATSETLTAEIIHQDIEVQDLLHICKFHYFTHQKDGSDEISVAGLSGLLADEQNAGKIKGKTVDDTGIDDGKFLGYDSETETIKYFTPSGTGDMLKETYDPNEDGVVKDSDKLEGSTKAEVQDHTPKTHKDSHKTGQSDAFTTSDELDALARINARKNSGTTLGPWPRINFVEGSNTTITHTQSAVNKEHIITIGQTGATGWTFKQLPFNYLIYLDGSDYKALNGVTGDIQFTSADKDTTTQNAINALPSGGTIFLQQIQLGTVTYGSSILIIEEYQGQRNIYFNQGKRDSRESNFIASGRSPITVAHNLGSTPSFVQATAKALQPYAWAVNWDATNVYIYHSGTMSVTFSVCAKA